MGAHSTQKAVRGMSGAERNRRRRDRRRRGVRVYYFEAEEDRLEELLERLGFLGQTVGEHDVGDIDRAVQAFVAHFVDMLSE
jgi:hypothetical protein